jgi:hypothetical protein
MGLIFYLVFLLIYLCIGFMIAPDLPCLWRSSSSNSLDLQMNAIIAVVAVLYCYGAIRMLVRIFRKVQEKTK